MTWDLVSRAEVKPLDAGKVEEFLIKYCPGEGASAFQSLTEKGLLELYQNPYRLSLLVEELEDGAIPNDRATLFTHLILRSLLRDLRHKKIEAEIESYLGLDCCRSLRGARALPKPTAGKAQGPFLSELAALAFERQLEHPGRPIPWRIEEFYEALVSRSGVDEEWIEGFLALAVRTAVLERDPVEGLIRFPHQQMQEYLAARHWIRTLDERAFSAADKLERVDDPRWNPPLSELLKELRPGQRLAERPPTGWEETALMAADLASDDIFVERLVQYDFVTAGRAVLGPGRSPSEAVQKSVRRILAGALQNPDVELRARVSAGEVLDDPTYLGYTRCSSENNENYLWPPFAELPKGVYTIGSREDERNTFDDERPQHAFRLENPLGVACHPVTNAEYALFMRAGGYDDERWWPEGESREWWKGERPDTSTQDIVDEVQGWSESFFQELLETRGWDESSIEARKTIRSMSREEAIELFSPKEHSAKLKRPRYWTDPTYNRPLQPVVGVSVFEAEAYALWLRHASGSSVRLLSEREWEACARGVVSRQWAYSSDSSLLSWLRRFFSSAEGDSPPPGTFNTNELGLRRPHPIRAFPVSRTPEGIYDLSGNIWEWTNSGWTDNYKQTNPSPLHRVVRGGSWYIPMDNARGAYRGRNPLDNRNNNLGFRLCLAPPLQSTGP